MHGISLAVLAGGQSVRFGSNKALTPIGGKPILHRVLAAAAGLADEIFVVTNTPEAYPDLGLPLVSDIRPAGGALRGLHTALSTATQPWVLCLACDMPFLQTALLRFLCERALAASAPLGVVVPRHADGFEPFCAIYNRSLCLPELEPLLDSGRWRMIGLYERVPVEAIALDTLRAHDPELLSFLNINTPDDLVAANTLAQRLGL